MSPILISSIFIIVMGIWIDMGKGRILTRCQFIEEMLKVDSFNAQELAVWACIAQYESKLNTSATTTFHSKWSTNYGLFQVSDRTWCKSNGNLNITSPNLCQQYCENLLDDNIADAIKCAKYIKRRQGWKAWPIYTFYCYHSEPDDNLRKCIDSFSAYNKTTQ